VSAYLGLELLTLLRILQRRGRFKLLQHHTDWYRRESCQYDEPVRRTRTKGDVLSTKTSVDRVVENCST